MNIRGLEGLSDSQIEMELANGGKFVVFEYCISIIVMTFRQPSALYFIKSSESPFMVGLPYTVLSLLLGWWGFPWGPIYTFSSIATNLRGGKDITDAVTKHHRE